jgi:hypothetical protein
MIPSIGRVVIYNHPGDATGRFSRKQSPAIITNVHGESMEQEGRWVVDLFVFTAPTWEYDNVTTMGTCVAGGGTYHNLKCMQGDGPLQWNWPERV